MKSLLLVFLISLMDQFIALGQSLTLENMALFTLGSVVYFIVEYKKLRDNPTFKWGYWIKDNWYNVLLSLAFMLAYLIKTPESEGWVVFILGAVPNYAIDRIQALTDKYTSKKP